MDTQTLESFRHRLRDRGQRLLWGGSRTLAEEQELLDQREPEWEDLTADQATAARLDRIGESEAQELARIRASLDRMFRGTYGDCVICHASIETERLRAIPDVDRCAGCSHR